MVGQEGLAKGDMTLNTQGKREGEVGANLQNFGKA